jgi:hypothetical protein
MTIAIGTKVQISESYLIALRNPDETVTKVRGRFGVVTGHNADFVEVTPSEPDATFWDIPYLFLPHEVVVLEEAHPLQKEFAKS